MNAQAKIQQKKQVVKALVVGGVVAAVALGGYFVGTGGISSSGGIQALAAVRAIGPTVSPSDTVLNYQHALAEGNIKKAGSYYLAIDADSDRRMSMASAGIIQSGYDVEPSAKTTMEKGELAEVEVNYKLKGEDTETFKVALRKDSGVWKIDPALSGVLIARDRAIRAEERAKVIEKRVEEENKRLYGSGHTSISESRRKIFKDY